LPHRKVISYILSVAPFITVDELFEALADERPGDVVTALGHALQCAWLLKLERPDDEELQLAGLVHDVASSIEPRPPGCHAAVGAELVRPLLGERISALVAGHVAAKRWLVTCDPSYRNRLSSGSRLTLAQQGQEFSAAERAAFEKTDYAADCILLRRADDDAKQPERLVPELDYWRSLAERIANRVKC
jgi:predicted HD phosphohydrolase